MIFLCWHKQKHPSLDVDSEEGCFAIVFFNLVCIPVCLTLALRLYNYRKKMLYYLYVIMEYDL